MASSFGTAGAFALLLFWIYYSSQIFLIGAEFTRAWADAVYPTDTAIKLILDNDSAQISKETKTWLTAKPEGRFTFVFTPFHYSRRILTTALTAIRRQPTVPRADSMRYIGRAGRANMVDPSYYGVGYMNAYHQRVVAHGRTRLDRSPVMVIRCAVCGHYYGAAEARLIAQRCPSHDKELEGQTAAADIEWLEPRQPEAHHVSRGGSTSPYGASRP